MGEELARLAEAGARTTRAIVDLPPDLLSLPAAAARLGIGRTTAFELARAGKFPGDAAIKVGAKWRVSVPKLERYLHGQEA